MPPSTTLWYFADPMCSWCWGFSPVIEQIHSQYHAQLNIALMIGGLRPGTTEPITPDLRDEILHHWQEVHKMTGQTFTFEGAMPEGFIYDTEPAGRAVITVGELNREKTFPYLKSIQQAFYIEQRDVTKEAVLAELATAQGIEQNDFLRVFRSERLQEKTLQHFQGARKAGVRGFPSLVLQKGDRSEFISRGYAGYDVLAARIDGLLAGETSKE